MCWRISNRARYNKYMNTRALLVCIVVVLIAVWGATYLPLSTESVRIVKLADASDSIAVAAGQHMRQRVHLSVGTYSGIAVFSDAVSMDERVLMAFVEDRQGRRVAVGQNNSITYRSSANVTRIEVDTSWFTVTHDDFYVLDMVFPHGEQLPLRTIARDSNLSAVHKLSLDGDSKPAILSLSFMKRIPAVFGLRQGIIIGVAFLLAVVLISLMQDRKKKLWAAIVIIIIFAPLAILGYWFSDGDLGIADWDYYFTLHDSYRRAILEHRTFPLWNPYICGGTAGLADPEFPIFSPTFLLELIFGVPLGIKFAISFSVAVTGIGMLILARRLGRSVEAGLIAALAVAFGTVSLLEITEGHVNVLAAMWIPWILWSWHRMVFVHKKPIFCGIFLALTFLGGGIYLLMYTALAFIGLLLFARNRRIACMYALQAALWALGLSAFKLIPVLLWLRQFPDDAYASSSYTLPWLGDILFGRHLHGAYVIADQASGWHEYGAYIGYIVFGLALIGLSYCKVSRTVRVLVLASVVAIGLSTLGPQLRPLFNQLWFFPRSSISRFILFAVIPIGLLASYGIDRVAGYFPRNGAYIRVFVVSIIAIDIFSLTYQLSEQAFVLPHVVPQISAAPYPIAFTPQRFDATGDGSRMTRAYDAYRAGYSTFTYCSVLGPKPSVRTIYDEDSGIVSVLDHDATTELLSWGYNSVRVRVTAPRDTTIVLNTNYADGWTANGQKVIIIDNRVAAVVAAGTHEDL